MMTFVKERVNFDTIIEISNSGDIQRVVSGELYKVEKQDEKVDNIFLIFLEKNGYKCIRSNKKEIQEYQHW